MNIETFIDRTGQSVMVSEGTAFGPVFSEDEDPHKFINWAFVQGQSKELILAFDADALKTLVGKWRKEEEFNENEAQGERYYSDTAATTLDEICEKAKGLK